MDISQIINELGEDRENYFNAVAPPIMQTSNFAFKKVADLAKAFEDEMGGYLYSRGLNPTVDILRKKLAALDGAEDCLIFNNGAAAIFAGIFANVKSGDHIVSVKAPYTWVQRMFDVILPRFGVTATYIDGTTLQNWDNATRPNTTFYYLESPNSWDFAIQPIQEVAAMAKSKGIITLIDNSYSTPLYQKPIEMGIDMAMQTATGNIGNDAETRHIPSGEAVVGFNVAVKSGYGDKAVTTWVRCAIWGKRGEAVAPYLLKGQLVGIVGEVTNRKYEKDGQEKFSLDVRVSDLTLLGKKDEAREPATRSAQVDFNDPIPF